VTGAPRRPRVLMTIGRDPSHPAARFGIPTSYINALITVGADPVLLPPGLARGGVERLVADMDGLLLPGGVDPHPRHFHEAVHHAAVIDEELDAIEFAVIDSALRRRIPILGICRGSQILNMALGGSLIQHLHEDPIDHRPDGPLDRHVHRIDLVEGSRLRQLAGVAEMAVNSWHHQAVARLGAGLHATAFASDGVVEAVESTDPDRWIVGVQYHPEELLDRPAHRRLFDAFFDASTQPRPALTERTPYVNQPLSPSRTIGTTVVTSGLVGRGCDGSVAATVDAQLAEVLRQLDAILAGHARERSDVAAVNVYLTDLADIGWLNAAFEDYFSVPYPARTTLRCGLAPGILVELNAIIDGGA
jgi:putative glutamine amidotransferase